MPETAERRPRRTGGVPNDAHDGGNVKVRVTQRWHGATRYSVSAWREIPHDPYRGLADALDHLDRCGLCCCWVANRRHRRAA